MRSIGAILIIVALPAAGVVADGAPTLEHNPFARPPSKTPESVRGEVFGVPAGTIVLTATMVSSGRRLAHVNGVVMRPGDELDGNKLLRVFEDRAVFLKDGEESTVFVKPELNEDDEQQRQSPRRR